MSSFPSKLSLSTQQTNGRVSLVCAFNPLDSVQQYLVFKSFLLRMDVNLAKIIVVFVLGFGSMFSGLIPAVLTRYNLRRNPILQTILLCFGAGILLATSIIHMLPEVRTFSRFTRILLILFFVLG